MITVNELGLLKLVLLSDSVKVRLRADRHSQRAARGAVPADSSKFELTFGRLFMISTLTRTVEFHTLLVPTGVKWFPAACPLPPKFNVRGGGVTTATPGAEPQWFPRYPQTG